MKTSNENTGSISHSRINSFVVITGIVIAVICSLVLMGSSSESRSTSFLRENSESAKVNEVSVVKLFVGFPSMISNGVEIISSIFKVD